MESTDTPTGPAPTAPRWTPTPVIDWIAAAVIAVIGLTLTIGGTTLTFVVDRALLGETVTAGELTVLVFERELTRIETLEVTRAVIEWTGIGLLVTGLGLIVFAVGYVIARRRSTRDEVAVGTGWAVVVYGAVATTVLSFLPASPVFGGRSLAISPGSRPTRPSGAARRPAWLRWRHWWCCWCSSASACTQASPGLERVDSESSP